MELSRLFVPSVYLLIFFLGYPSQYLLLHLEPAPMTQKELVVANVVLVLIWITYTRSVFVDAGRIPRDWVERVGGGGADEKGNGKEKEDGKEKKSRKWCRKCDAAKPPRAHHCKECKRCIPKMDHHCPWTQNCVSHTTFPHFLRFLLYTTLGLTYLQLLLLPRLTHLWQTSHLPSTLGPTPFQLIHLFTTLLTNTITLFALSILLLRNLWCLAVNTTTIEGWEIERHRTLLRRARHFGGYLDDSQGNRIRIKKQEFPYDIGIWANIVAGMGGSRNPINWFNPLAATPGLDKGGLVWETNGFEDEGTVWPPPDPDRAYRKVERAVNVDAFVFEDEGLEGGDMLEAFKRRQAEDVVRRRPFVERLEEREEGVYRNEEEGLEYGDDASDAEEDYTVKGSSHNGVREGEEGWRNSEGERLQDFGVDEDVEFYDEQDDEIPLNELLARRQAAASSAI
ncbi:palmitoyltransferase pfa4 [Plenodomus tracheiphilus IPT5]|uniref:Palmitoyltransferase PFA4 n=1 Tax=Plenodomus tracheiphilus IPT5 TaxID=1408161 RepID=A0A6A7BMQ5_9PLEO|nr:palmitoyltransferase pfa4 [Plenodomus tracheiphilus IPT5]